LDGKYPENPTKMAKNCHYLGSRISEKSGKHFTDIAPYNSKSSSCPSLLWINHSFLLLLLGGHGFRGYVGV